MELNYIAATANSLRTPDLTTSPSSSVESSPLLHISSQLPSLGGSQFLPLDMTTKVNGQLHSPTQLALLENDLLLNSLSYSGNDYYCYPSSYGAYPQLPSSQVYYTLPASSPHAHPGTQQYLQPYFKPALNYDHYQYTHQPSLGSSAAASNHGSGPIRKFQCPKCSRAFARQFNLKQHMETHNPLRVKPFLCTYPTCGKRFSRKHDLLRHMNSIHHQQKKCCSTCAHNHKSL